MIISRACGGLSSSSRRVGGGFARVSSQPGDRAGHAGVRRGSRIFPAAAARIGVSATCRPAVTCPLPTAYGMEEVDFGLRLHALGGRVLRSGQPARVSSHRSVASRRSGDHVSEHRQRRAADLPAISALDVGGRRGAMRQSHPVAAASRPPARRVERPGRRSPPRLRSIAANGDPLPWTRGAIVSVAEARTTTGVTRAPHQLRQSRRAARPARRVCRARSLPMAAVGRACGVAGRTASSRGRRLPSMRRRCCAMAAKRSWCSSSLSGFFIHFRAAEARSRRAVSRRPVLPAALASIGAAVLFRARRHAWRAMLIGRTWWPTLYVARTGDALLDPPSLAAGISQTSVVPAVLLLPSSLGRDFGSNGPLWSLAFEAVYYAIYPLWLWVRRRSCDGRVRRDSGCCACRWRSVPSAGSR